MYRLELLNDGEWEILERSDSFKKLEDEVWELGFEEAEAKFRIVEDGDVLVIYNTSRSDGDVGTLVKTTAEWSQTFMRSI